MKPLIPLASAVFALSAGGSVMADRTEYVDQQLHSHPEAGAYVDIAVAVDSLRSVHASAIRLDFPFTALAEGGDRVILEAAALGPGGEPLGEIADEVSADPEPLELESMTLIYATGNICTHASSSNVVDTVDPETHLLADSDHALDRQERPHMVWSVTPAPPEPEREGERGMRVIFEVADLADEGSGGGASETGPSEDGFTARRLRAVALGQPWAFATFRELLGASEPGVLKHALKIDGSWQMDVVDSSSSAVFTHVAMDRDDHPHVVWFDTLSAQLKHAGWNGAHWQQRVVDDSADLKFPVGLTLDPVTEQLVVEYYGIAPGSAYHAFAQLQPGGWIQTAAGPVLASELDDVPTNDQRAVGIDDRGHFHIVRNSEEAPRALLHSIPAFQADLDGDGVVAGIETALGTDDGYASGPRIVPTFVFVDIEPGHPELAAGKYAGIRFRVPYLSSRTSQQGVQTDELVYSVQVSGDLGDWHSGSDHVWMIEGPPPPPPTELPEILPEILPEVLPVGPLPGRGFQFGHLPDPGLHVVPEVALPPVEPPLPLWRDALIVSKTPVANAHRQSLRLRISTVIQLVDPSEEEDDDGVRVILDDGLGPVEVLP